MNLSQLADEEFNKGVAALTEWLRDYANPHAIIIIDDNGGQLFSGERSLIVKYDRD